MGLVRATTCEVVERGSSETAELEPQVVKGVADSTGLNHEVDGKGLRNVHFMYFYVIQFS